MWCRCGVSGLRHQHTVEHVRKADSQAPSQTHGTLSPLMRHRVSTRSIPGPFLGKLANLWGTRLGHLYLVGWVGVTVDHWALPQHPSTFRAPRTLLLGAGAWSLGKKKE